MKNTKTQSGITLVALIITIIVLLILAIVSIRAIQQGGIIGKSQNAVGSYEDKRIEEENRISEYENLIDQYNDSEKIEYYVGYGCLYVIDYKTQRMQNYVVEGDKFVREGDELNLEIYTIAELEALGSITLNPDGKYIISSKGRDYELRRDAFAMKLIDRDGGFFIQDGILYTPGSEFDLFYIDPNFDVSKLED